jgi:hypothetical protein
MTEDRGYKKGGAHMREWINKTQEFIGHLFTKQSCCEVVMQQMQKCYL